MDVQLIEHAADVLLALAPTGVVLAGDITTELRDRFAASVVDRAEAVWRGLRRARPDATAWSRDDVREALEFLVLRDDGYSVDVEQLAIASPTTHATDASTHVHKIDAKRSTLVFGGIHARNVNNYDSQS